MNFIRPNEYEFHFCVQLWNDLFFAKKKRYKIGDTCTQMKFTCNRFYFSLSLPFCFCVILRSHMLIDKKSFFSSLFFSVRCSSSRNYQSKFLPLFFTLLSANKTRRSSALTNYWNIHFSVCQKSNRPANVGRFFFFFQYLISTFRANTLIAIYVDFRSTTSYLFSICFSFIFGYRDLFHLVCHQTWNCIRTKQT